MTPLFRTIALIAALGWAALTPAAADPLDTATPTEYRVTVQRVSLCTAADINNGTCTGQFDLVTGGTALDIASVATGASVGALVASAPTPTPGTYTHIQIEIGRSITMTGTVIDDDVGGNPPCHTDGNGTAATFGGFTNLIQGNKTPGAFTPVSQALNIPAVNDFRGAGPTAASFNGNGMVAVANADTTVTITIALPQPIVVAAGSRTPTIRINFDVAGAMSGGYISLTECVLYPGMPIVNIVITP